MRASSRPPCRLRRLRRFYAANVRPTDEWIDVGCGDGQAWGAWLDRRAARYVGVDISETAVEAARARGLEAIAVNDATELPFPDESFDAAVCTEVLEHLFEPQVATREIWRVLRPGGHLIATVPNVAFWRWRFDLAVHGRWNPFGDDLSLEQPWRDPHIRFFAPDSLQRMLDDCDFEVAETRWLGGVLVPQPRSTESGSTSPPPPRPARSFASSSGGSRRCWGCGCTPWQVKPTYAPRPIPAGWVNSGAGAIGRRHGMSGA